MRPVAATKFEYRNPWHRPGVRNSVFRTRTDASTKHRHLVIMSRQGRPKFETNSKYKCSNVQNSNPAGPLILVI
jgi:hypothetical protein